MSYLLAEAIKRLLDKEMFIQGNIHGSEKLPKGLISDDENNMAPFYKIALMKIIEILIGKRFDSDSRTFKNLLMVLFFYRLESMQFYNSLQFEVGTKDYYQGKFILDDILHVPAENPLLFLKVLQNVCHVKFSYELLRKIGIDKYSFVYNSKPFSIDKDNDEGEQVMNPIIKNYAPVSVRERMYYVMARLISTKEYQKVTHEQTGSDASLNSRYSSPLNRSEQSSAVEGEYEEEEDEAENESNNDSYHSDDTFIREDSPPFKQAKFDRTDSRALLNNMYSSRISLSSNYDNVLRASHSGINLSKNYIESDNDDKKLMYINKKVFLHLPSSLYRLKLNAIELDSFEASKMSIHTKELENADFLQEFSILRQSYPLPPLDQFNDLVIFIENGFKDVYSLEGDESAFLEIILINNILLFICNKFDDIYKLMEKVREMMFSISK